MRSSQWYNNRSQQSFLGDVPRVPTIVRVGPTGSSGTQRSKKVSDEKYFIVGRSQIGGEEVVG